MAQVLARPPFQFAVRKPLFMFHIYRSAPCPPWLLLVIAHQIKFYVQAPQLRLKSPAGSTFLPTVSFSTIGGSLRKHFTAPSRFAGHLLLHRYCLQPQGSVHYWLIKTMGGSLAHSSISSFAPFVRLVRHILLPAELGQGQVFQSTPSPSIISYS